MCPRSDSAFPAIRSVLMVPELLSDIFMTVLLGTVAWFQFKPFGLNHPLEAYRKQV
jgi:hypothetical protein